MSQREIVKLGDVSSSIDYGVTASANFEGVGNKFLRITDIQDDKVDWDAVPWCVCTDKELNKSRLNPGDIVFARTGATTGKSYLIQDCPLDTVFASYLIRVRLEKNIWPKFLSFFFQSPNYWNQVKLNARGAAQPGINATILKTLLIPLPPLDEQQKIIARLELAQRLIDQRKEQIALMDEMVQALFYEMFGDENMLRENYVHVSFKSLGISATAGKSVSGEGRPALEDEFGVLKVSAVTKGIFNSDENKAVFEKPKGQLIFPQSGDVLVTRANTRELVAACCVVPRDFKNVFLPDKIWRMNLNNALSNWYFKFIINVSYIRSEIIGKASGTSGSMLNISQQNFLETKIPLPPLPLQQTFADRAQQIEALKQQMQASLSELEQGFQALMQEAFDT